MIEISSRAAKELKIAIEEHKAQNPDDKQVYVRVAVKGGGCSGFKYDLTLEEGKNDKDKLFQIEGLDVVVDPKSVLYMEGTALDFIDELNNRGFKFSNPSVSSVCGCGMSFNM
jgi:iron-sulfur cluster assembly protein